MVQLIVNKIPRPFKIKDVPVDFPPLENLHLELMENKKKIKKGLPLIPRKTKSPKEIEELQKKLQHHGISTGPSTPTEIVIESKTPDRNLLNDLGDEKQSQDVHQDEPVSADEYEDEEEPEDEPEDEDDPYAGMSPEEREVAEKEEYLWRFRILKRKHRNTDIPQYNEHSDLKMMKLNYERTVKDLVMDQTVEQYRTYLTLGFLGIEWIGTEMMGIDLEGFSKQQSAMMDSYDALLVELGEKRQETWTSNLPVEIRLLGMIVFQAAIFYIGKIITSKYGGAVADVFQGITGKKIQTGENQDVDMNKSYKWTSSQTPGKKMRGPRVKPKDIRNMNHSETNEN